MPELCRIMQVPVVLHQQVYNDFDIKMEGVRRPQKTGRFQKSCKVSQILHLRNLAKIEKSCI